MDMQSVYRCCPGWMQRGEERGCLHSEYNTVCVCVMDTEYLNNACYLQECVLLVLALMEGSALRPVINYVSVQKGSRERAANTVSVLCLLKGLKFQLLNIQWLIYLFNVQEWVLWSYSIFIDLF